MLRHIFADCQKYFDRSAAEYKKARHIYGFKYKMASSDNCVVDALALGLFYLKSNPFEFISKCGSATNSFQWVSVCNIPTIVLDGTNFICDFMRRLKLMHNDGISFNATLVAMCQIYCPDEIPVIYISQANQSSSIVAWAQKMRFRFIVGVHNHAVLVVPFEG